MDRSETPPVPESFTEDYFASFRDLADLPAPYHRNIQERIFVTRDLNMNSINYVGCVYTRSSFFFTLLYSCFLSLG